MWSWMSWRICLGSTEGVGREGTKETEWMTKIDWDGILFGLYIAGNRNGFMNLFSYIRAGQHNSCFSTSTSFFMLSTSPLLLFFRLRILDRFFVLLQRCVFQGGSGLITRMFVSLWEGEGSI